jgi:hypothetical protein
LPDPTLATPRHPTRPAQAFIPDAAELRSLLEAMAYDCQAAAQPEEATELFLAAERPHLALAIINQQLADVVPQAVQDQVRARGRWRAPRSAPRGSGSRASCAWPA